MGTLTINTWHYYDVATIIATGETVWNLDAAGYGTITATYVEEADIDGVAQPGEVLNPDYSVQDATYLGTYTDPATGQAFIVLEDEFGPLLGLVAINEPASVFPASIDPDDITAAPTTACFLTSTAIATPDGTRPVEELRPGDPILTGDGRVVAVTWIGRQTVSTRFGPAERSMPVRVRAGALGLGLPLRDLVLTADHALLIDGMLVNAGALVNGASIDFVPLSALGDSYTVYHVETENHDVILAEGAPAETFITDIGRRAFDNHAEYLALYGEDCTIPEMAFPRITSARMLPGALRRVLGQAHVA